MVVMVLAAHLTERVPIFQIYKQTLEIITSFPACICVSLEIPRMIELNELSREAQPRLLEKCRDHGCEKLGLLKSELLRLQIQMIIEQWI